MSLEVIISLQCYEQLTKWPQLEQAVMVNVDDNDPPRLDNIWEDTYCQVYPIPYPCHLYLPTPGGFCYPYPLLLGYFYLYLPTSWVPCHLYRPTHGTFRHFYLHTPLELCHLYLPTPGVHNCHHYRSSTYHSYYMLN